MSVLKEFRDFAVKGNVVDLAIGVIIGTAFGKVVSALVDKILMPPLGYLIGGVDFSRLRLVLQLPGAGAGGGEEVAISYGDFIQAGVNFLIIAWTMFIVIKMMNKMSLGASPPPPGENVILLREIRDLLKERGGEKEFLDL